MAGKVFHVDDDVHASVKQYCALHNLTPKTWVQTVVLDAMKATPVTATVQPQRDERAQRRIKQLEAEVTSLKSQLREARNPPVPVRKKPSPMPMEETGSQPWAEPPFWANRGQDYGDKEATGKKEDLKAGEAKNADVDAPRRLHSEGAGAAGTGTKLPEHPDGHADRSGGTGAAGDREPGAPPPSHPDVY